MASSRKAPENEKRKRHIAPLAFLLDLGIEAHELAGRALGAFAEADAVADMELLGRAREGAPAIGALALVQHDLDAGGRLLAHAKAVEPGRDDLGVVEHQHVARLQQVRQVADAAILEAGLGPDHEHARAIARLHGAQRDAAFRQIRNRTGRRA